MATERLEVRQIREILRLRAQGRSVREVARSLGVSVGSVQKTAARATTAGLTWAAAEALDERTLDERLYGRPAQPGDDRPQPDPRYIHRELKRVGVTLELLHLEYLQAHRRGFDTRCSATCTGGGSRRPASMMRQTHKAGEKCFVDYSGKKDGCSRVFDRPHPWHRYGVGRRARRPPCVPTRFVAMGSRRKRSKEPRSLHEELGRTATSITHTTELCRFAEGLGPGITQSALHRATRRRNKHRHTNRGTSAPS